MTDKESAPEANAKASKKQTYVVIKPNTLDFELGETVQLTDQMAATLVNKVRLKDAVEAESKAGRKSKLETEHKELTARVAQLEGADAAKDNAVLTQRVSELEAQNKALHDENVKLKGAAK